MEEKKPLNEGELEEVAGGANAPKSQLMAAECSECGEIVMIQTRSLPSFGKCPRCEKNAYFHAPGYTFL